MKQYNYTKRLAFIALVALVSPLMLTVGAVDLAAQMPLDQQERSLDTESTLDRPILSLRDLNQAYIDIAATVKPAVVTVSTARILNYRQSPYGRSPFAGDPFFDFFFGPRNRQQPQQPPDREYRQQGLGSGVIVSADGRILTNNHVVDNADSIYVRTYDGNRYAASVIGVDPHTDIAVLQIDADADVPYIPIGNSDNLQVGEMVMAIGSPMSENLAYTVTQGIVSAKGRSNVGLADYEDFIQTDAAINPGNSGGPLVNLNGELVGINTAIASRSGGFQGIGFAVPSNMAERVMNSLMTEGKVVRGWLGVTIQNVDDAIANAMGLDEPGGALVGDVLEDSPADRAGLEAGDIILSIDGRPIAVSSQLRSQVASTPPDQVVDLEVLRGDRVIDIQVTLGELPSDLTQAMPGGAIEQSMGFAVENLTSDLAQRYDINPRLQGVVVTSIESDSPAFEGGLREGDVILSVNRQRVQSESQFRDRISALDEGDTVLLRVSRQGSGFFVAFNR